MCSGVKTLVRHLRISESSSGDDVGAKLRDHYPAY